MTKRTNANRPRKCAKCGRVIEQAATGRPPKYCPTGGCKQRAYLDRIRQRAEEAGRDAGGEEAREELRDRSLLA